MKIESKKVFEIRIGLNSPRLSQNRDFFEEGIYREKKKNIKPYTLEVPCFLEDPIGKT